MSVDSTAAVGGLEFPIDLTVDAGERDGCSIQILQEIPETVDLKSIKDLKTLRIRSSVHEQLTRGQTRAYKVRWKSLDEELTGVLYHIRDNVYGMVPRCDGGEERVSVATKVQSYVLQEGREEIIKKWCVIPLIYGLGESLKDVQLKIKSFSMKRRGPSTTDIQHDESGEITTRLLTSTSLSPTKTSPREFLNSRYYNTLYSQNTPLSYFPKTAVTRFKNMCSNSDSIVQDLRKLCILAEELDERHSGRFGLIIPNQVTSGDRFQDIERDCRKEFLGRHRSILGPSETEPPLDTKKVSQVYQLSLELKIRETQLQVVILLELLCHWLSIGEDEFFATNIRIQENYLRQIQQKTKQQLVRKRGPKRKVVPTFLGMGVVLNTPVSSSNATDDFGVFIYTTLNSFIDRIGIWDTLSERKTEAGTYEFLAYVLVPYYNKRIPVTTKYVIDKIKGLTLKFTRKSSNSSNRSSASPKKEITHESAASLTSSTPHPLSPPVPSPVKPQETISAVRPSKYRKTLLREKRPLLTSISLSILGDDLLPAFSIKRSKSVLSSKNLEKRQVDVSKSFSEEKSSASNNFEQPITRFPANDKFIFGNAKKSKSTTIISKKEDISHQQVLATPIKKSKSSIAVTSSASGSALASTSTSMSAPISTSQVQSTPLKSHRSTQSTNKTMSTSQVQSTPHTTRLVVLETPEQPQMAPPRLKPSIFEKLQESASKDNHTVESSPVGPIIASSPVTSVKRKRPGEPISAQDSPFFGSNFQGSPISSSKRDGDSTDDDENGIDLDYERLLKKITPQKSKSVFGRASKAYKHT